MATGGAPPDPSAPKGSPQSDREGEESAPTAPSLLCVLCAQELRDPHLLCCLHLVCKECLGRVEQQDGRLKCPQCGDTSTHLPQGQNSVRTCCPPTAEVQCVPVPCVSLAQHIEACKLLQKLTSGELILCSNRVCRFPQSPVVVLCFKCKDFLCQTCSSAHQLMARLTEGHTVKSLSELRSLPPSVLQSLVPQTVTPVTCPCHEGEPLKYCCERCDTLLCQACTVDKDLGHQPRYLNRAAVAQHAQCLVVARKAVVRSGEVQQKAAARLEAQSTTVLVNRGHVRGSPFAVQLGTAILQNGHWLMMRSATSLGAIKGSLQFPQQPGGLYGVAVSPVNGSVFVCDNANSQIHVFDVERKHVRTFGQRGQGEGQLSFPLGIDVSANSQVYVANLFNHCVNVFREDGTFIRTIGQGKLQYPRGVLVHSSGLVYVADWGNHCIAVFSQKGELVRTFRSQGGGKREFMGPSGVAVSADDHHLYVSDLNNLRVQVFTPEGRYVREFGTDQLKRPHGLTVTSDGSVLVADDENNCVAVFDKKGKLVHSIAVKDPTGLAIDSRGDLLVTSFENKCVYYI